MKAKTTDSGMIDVVNKFMNPSVLLDTPTTQLLAAALGIAGEAGEFADSIKKIMYQGHAMDEHALIVELGDVLFYVCLALQALGSDVDEATEFVREKLTRRYGNGFTTKASTERVEYVDPTHLE